MKTVPPSPIRLLSILAVSALTACGTPPVHQSERFDPQAPFQYRIPTELERACEAARLALLSQGYGTEQARPDQLKGSKTFQPETEIHVVLEFNVVCAATRFGTTLYTTAQETRYELKKTSHSAGLGVAGVGSISLPWGSSTEALVKVGGHTIDDPEFYKRFYELVDKQLGIKMAH
jgi:hypothetical protein